MSKNQNLSANKDGYDRWSSFYDTYPNPTIAMDELYFPNLFAGLKGKRVLEIGCGTGRHTKKLVVEENHVTAIDISPGMLEVARQKLDGQSVEFIEADFLTCKELGVSKYNAVVASLVIEHIEDCNLAFRRTAKLLKDGGQLFVSEIHPSRTQAGVLAHFKDPTSGKEVHLTGFPHTEAEFVEAATIAGFKVVTNIDVTGNTMLAEVKPAWKRFIGVPMIKMFEFRKRS